MRPIGKDTSILIIGGNRGLGLEVARLAVTSSDRVIVTCRGSNEDLEAIGAYKIVEGIDMAEHGVGDKLVRALGSSTSSIDVVICVAGVFTTDTWDDIQRTNAVAMYEVCALGPLDVASALVSSGLVSEGSRIAFITSEGGSISIRTVREGGNNYGHHMSKAAQNMMGKILSIDLYKKGIPVQMFHPGFMKTSMTEHYAWAYEELGAVTPAESAEKVLDAVGRMTMETTGQFIAPFGTYALGFGVYGIDGELPEHAEIPF